MAFPPTGRAGERHGRGRRRVHPHRVHEPGAVDVRLAVRRVRARAPLDAARRAPADPRAARRARHLLGRVRQHRGHRRLVPPVEHV